MTSGGECCILQRFRFFSVCVVFFFFERATAFSPHLHAETLKFVTSDFLAFLVYVRFGWSEGGSS